MKKTRKKLAALFLSMAMAFSLAGCGSDGDSSTTAATTAGNESESTGGEAAATGGTLNVAYNAQPATFDPMTTGATATREITRMVFEGLFELDADGNPQPQLCESFEKNDTNTEWTFKLRQGVKFHNGEEMKAKDVVASLNRWIDKFTVAQRSIKEGERFEAVDDYTVKISLKNPCLLLPYLLANYSQFAAILPESVIHSLDKEAQLSAEQLIGTGSFKFVEWSVDNYVKLEKFEDYQSFTAESSGSWGDRTALVDTVMIYFITDTTTRLNGLQTGEYDIAASIAYTDADRLKSMEGVSMMSSNWNSMTITINKSEDSIMNDKKWRQVIAYAINLDEIMEGAIPSIGDYTAYKADACYFGEDSPWYIDISQVSVQDKEKAKELLQELNYDGTPLKMMTTEAYPEFYNATLVMKQQLEDVGLKVDFQVMDWGTMLTKLADTTTFDLYPMNYPLSSNPASVLYLMKTNASGFTNDEQLNNYIIEMQSMKTYEEAIRFWKETVQPYCSEEVFTVHLGTYDYVYGVSDHVSGFDPYFGLKLWGVSKSK